MYAYVSYFIFSIVSECAWYCSSRRHRRQAKLYTDKACLTCHGEAGNKPIMTTYPKIAGQNADYLVQQMKDIKSGARNNGQAAAMKALVATVTDDEFAKIAKYLEAQLLAPRLLHPRCRSACY